MISFKGLGRYGQLGNQMFEIAATIGTAYTHKTDYTFNYWKYNKYFENTIPENKSPAHLSYSEQTFHYTPIKLDPKKHWDLRGYFQSYKYFSHISEIIKNQFELKREYVEMIEDNYPILNARISMARTFKTCAIHVRRGDFLKLLDYHTVQDLDYYEKAINYLYPDNKNEIDFFVCSDDIEWCKQNLPKLGVKLHFMEGNENIIDMFIMSKCANNINSASSFSWWASYLNKNNNKAIFPKVWFGPKYRDLHDTKDLLLPEWIRI